MMWNDPEANTGVHIRLRAHDWLRQSEHLALAGKLDDARALLIQLWGITCEHEPRFANAAAWHLAWLLLQTHSYIEAAEWFQRVAAPMADESTLWDSAREAQVHLCQLLAGVQAETSVVLAREHGGADRTAQLTPLVVTNLGNFAIARGGQSLPRCKSRKAVGVFRYLLQQNGTATREELIETFWPETTREKGAHSLHVAIKALRQYLDLQPSYVVFDLGSYFLHPDALIDDDRKAFLAQCDAGDRHWRANQHMAAQQAYEHAIHRYAADYYVDSCDGIWALTEREHLLSRYLVGLERLGDLAARQSAYDRAMTYYQLLLQRDEYREDIHGRVMRCCQQLGRRRDAIAQYERCASALRRDLGVDPMPETQRIYREIISAG